MTSCSIIARGGGGVVGVVAVDQQVDVGVDVGEGASYDVALALQRLGADDRAGLERALDRCGRCCSCRRRRRSCPGRRRCRSATTLATAASSLWHGTIAAMRYCVARDICSTPTVERRLSLDRRRLHVKTGKHLLGYESVSTCPDVEHGTTATQPAVSVSPTRLDRPARAGRGGPARRTPPARSRGPPRPLGASSDGVGHELARGPTAGRRAAMSTNRTPGPAVQGECSAGSSLSEHRQPAAHRLEHGERALADRRHDHHVDAAVDRAASRRPGRRRGSAAAGRRARVVARRRRRRARSRHWPRPPPSANPFLGTKRPTNRASGTSSGQAEILAGSDVAHRAQQVGSGGCRRRCRAPRSVSDSGMVVAGAGRDVLVDRQDRRRAREHEPGEGAEHDPLHQAYDERGVVHEAHVPVDDVRRAQQQAPERGHPAGEVERVVDVHDVGPAHLAPQGDEQPRREHRERHPEPRLQPVPRADPDRADAVLDRAPRPARPRRCSAARRPSRARRGPGSPRRRRSRARRCAGRQ